MTTNLIKASPITTLTSAEATALALLAFLVAHGVIPAEVAKTYGPYFVIVYVVAFGFAKWWHVMPWAKGRDLVDQLADGRLPDADLARVQAVVADVVHEALGSSWLDTHATGSDHPDALAVGTPANQDPAALSIDETPHPNAGGMSAGAPEVGQ